MTTLNTIIEEEKKKLEDTAGYNYNLYLAWTVDRVDTGEGWTFEQAGKEIKDFLATAMQRAVKAERVNWLRSEIEKLEGMNSCRFGCYCPLCALCDEDTFIHCSNCVMNKPTIALTSIITRYKEELLELEKEV